MHLDPLILSRFQFAWVIGFHILLPAFTVGLASYIALLEGIHFITRREIYLRLSMFWTKIFAISFGMGVVSGIVMPFQFGTNWAAFSKTAGGVIGQTLAMEGVFSFFLESSFLGLFLYSEKRAGPKLHLVSAVLVFLGSWLSGFFIIATDAWMQHPVGYVAGPNGELLLGSFARLLLNPWIVWQYLHNMIASVVTASFVMAGLGAFYLLAKRSLEYGAVFVRVGVVAGLAGAGLVTTCAIAADVQAVNMVAQMVFNWFYS